MKHWQDYFRSSYELIIEAEGKAHTYLNEDLESYLVRLLARCFDRNDIPPDTPVSIMLMTAMNGSRDREQQLAKVADTCLFYDSFKYKMPRWPSPTYYKDMGKIAYGMAHVAGHNDLYEQLEHNFTRCSKVLSSIVSNK